MLLESALDPSEKGTYPFQINGKQISFNPAVRRIAEDVHNGIPAGSISAKFHNAVIGLVFQLSLNILRIHEIDTLNHSNPGSGV